MAQHDYVIANGTGAAVRSDLNNALAAIVSQNSGATAPATTYAFQFWADTTTGLLKLRNSANSAWVTLFQLDGEWSTLPVENGTAAAPSIYFKDSGTDTGFYSPGTDQIGISTAGTSRLTIDANGNLAVDTNTLYVDAPNNRVGIGTSSPGAPLNVRFDNAGLTTVALFENQRSVGGSPDAAQIVVGSRTYNHTVIRQNSDQGTNAIGGTLDTVIANTYGSPGAKLILATQSTARLTVDASGNVGIGTTDNEGFKLKVTESGGNLARFTNGATQTMDVVLDSNGFTLQNPNNGYIAFKGSSTERARIDSSGRLLVGTSSSPSAGQGAASLFVVQGFNGGTTNLGIVSLQRGETAANITAGEELGRISFNDSAGNAFGWIECTADASAGTNDYPGRLVFSTTADSASSPSERFRIANNGAWGLAGANYGSSGQVLTSNGSGSAPTWQATSGALTVGTAVNSTSGTSIDFTGIPSTVKRIHLIFDGVSLSGSSIVQVQVGSTTFTTTGYNGSNTYVTGNTINTTTGFGVGSSGTNSYARYGNMIIANVTGNKWVASYAGGLTGVAEMGLSGGSIALSGVLDRVRVTSVNGTDTFDAGTINIMYES